MAQEMIVDGVTTRWLEHGEGRPVLLAHGIPTSPRLWRKVMPLGQGRSLAWEVLGYDRSIPGADGGDIGLASQADRVVAWLWKMRLAKVVPVGHALGGGVAKIAAVRAPELFLGIVLTNTVCYDS